jgi:hypothetical protein
VPAWLVSVGAGAAGGLAVAVVMEWGHRAQVVDTPLVAETWEAPPVEAPDAGVGDHSLTEAVNVPRVEVPAYGLGLPMPKKPTPGQRKPPCHPTAEVESLGACWALLSLKPPCDGFGYELDGRCVIASFDSPRQPASDPP